MKLRDKLSRLESAAPRGLEEENVLRDEGREARPRFASAVQVEAGLEADRATRISHLRAQLELMRGKVRAPGQSFERHVVTLDDDDASGRERSPGSLPGELHETPHGPLRRVVTRYEEDHRHGSIPVALALEACARDLSVLALDPTLENTDFTRALYIDTETTGLAGGSGTLPFLIGAAWFEGARLVVEQLVLEKPGLETPMLVRLGELLGEATCVVSYNGKSFDWPLLRTRFILNRVPVPPLPGHLDLLHCARRVYKRRLGTLRLVHLEQEILGFERVGDIAGELIPETYLGFLRGKVRGAELAPIIEHNRSDVVALSAILGELVRRFRGGEEQDARDLMGFAGVAARADDQERALAFANGVVEADVRGELAPDALYLAGDLKLKSGDLDGACAAFHASVEAAAPVMERAARAHLALAKLYEHRLRMPERALEHARHAAVLEGSEASERRIQRLARKRRSTPSLF